MTTDALIYECALDAAPEKVWRALTIPAYLERWLTPDAAAGEALDLTVLAAEENKSLSYHWREAGQGAVGDVEDSVVTFELKPMADGRTGSG
ncbi:SRPBCC domain-containing protein [Devosia sp. A8/3-2]|nr:SRPBCC domain-containing protein [Devosia sp. A8/3-2]